MSQHYSQQEFVTLLKKEAAIQAKLQEHEWLPTELGWLAGWFVRHMWWLLGAMAAMAASISGGLPI